MALKQQCSKGLQNNDCLRSLNNRTPASVPYIVNKTLLLLHKEHNKGHFLYLKVFLLLLLGKVIIQRAFPLRQLSRDTGMEHPGHITL